MQFIIYSLLFVYAMPIFFILFAGFVSNWFTLYGSAVYIANIISGEFFTLFRDTFGSIVVPLVTAYSIQKREPDAALPKATLHLFACLIVFFVVLTCLYGVVKYNEEHLAEFNREHLDIPKIFLASIFMYAKETLAYIALVLGITLKK